MRTVEPQVRLIAYPHIEYSALADYLAQVGGSGWMEHLRSNTADDTDVENLVEASGRLCYRSWEPGLNPNVNRVRTDQGAYLDNILASGHGSVLEHANFTFLFSDVSRVLTHELVRHRAGSAFSQESLRFVRLDDLPVWLPDWATADPELMDQILGLLTRMEDLQIWMAEHFGLNEEGVSFAEKKLKTSFMRRLAPEGVATSLMWTANIRTLRHVIATRTAPGAEEEIRLVFGKVGELMKTEAPLLFGDFTVEDGTWIPKYPKV